MNPARKARFSLSKTAARVRARGAGEVIADVGGRIKAGVTSHDEILFLTRRSDWGGPAPSSTREPLVLVDATRDDGPDYARFIGTDSAPTFAARLTERTRCWLVRGRGMILHATWTTTDAAWTRELGRYFVTPPGSAYIYESFTRPEARGLGLYPFALLGIGKELAARGIETLYVGVEVGNRSSLRAITKAGFEPAFSVRFRRRLGVVVVEDATGPRADLAARCLPRA